MHMHICNLDTHVSDITGVATAPYRYGCGDVGEAFCDVFDGCEWRDGECVDKAQETNNDKKKKAKKVKAKKEKKKQKTKAKKAKRKITMKAKKAKKKTAKGGV